MAHYVFYRSLKYHTLLLSTLLTLCYGWKHPIWHFLLSIVSLINVYSRNSNVFLCIKVVDVIYYDYAVILTYRC